MYVMQKLKILLLKCIIYALCNYEYSNIIYDINENVDTRVYIYQEKSIALKFSVKNELEKGLLESMFA